MLDGYTSNIDSSDKIWASDYYTRFNETRELVMMINFLAFISGQFWHTSTTFLHDIWCSFLLEFNPGLGQRWHFTWPMGTGYTSTKLFNELMFGTGFNVNSFHINQDILQAKFNVNSNLMSIHFILINQHSEKLREAFLWEKR